MRGARAAYVSIGKHTSAYAAVSRLGSPEEHAQHTSAYVSIRCLQHTSAYLVPLVQHAEVVLELLCVELVCGCVARSVSALKLLVYEALSY
jgi:hypothetical protein